MKLQVAAGRVSLWVAAHTSLSIFDRFVEFVLYPLVILSFGLVKGLLIMMVFSLVVCWILLALYDWISTIDASEIESPYIRVWVEILEDVLGFETLKTKAAELREELFEPVVITPARDYHHVHVRWMWFLKTAHWLHLALFLRYIRKASNAVLYVAAVLRNMQLRVWEPIRRVVVAPIARWLFRHKLEKLAVYLYSSLAYDGMTTLILVRPAHDHSMGLREWLLFIPSVILSCIGWGLLVGGGIQLLHFFTHVVK